MVAHAIEYIGVGHVAPGLPVRCRLARTLLRWLGRSLFRVRVQGLEHVPRGNCIVVANHLSWLDPFLLLLFLPPNPRIYIAGASQAVRERWQARAMRFFDLLIPFERGARWMGKQPLRQAFQALDAGASLALFPEGDVGPREGALMPFRTGVGHFLSRVQVPVLPVALSGTRDLWWRKPIRMIIGEPFVVAMETGNHKRAIGAAVERVEEELRRLLPPYVEPPARRRPFRRLLTDLGGPMADVSGSESR